MKQVHEERWWTWRNEGVLKHTKRGKKTSGACKTHAVTTKKIMVELCRPYGDGITCLCEDKARKVQQTTAVAFSNVVKARENTLAS